VEDAEAEIGEFNNPPRSSHAPSHVARKMMKNFISRRPRGPRDLSDHYYPRDLTSDMYLRCTQLARARVRTSRRYLAFARLLVAYGYVPINHPAVKIPNPIARSTNCAIKYSGLEGSYETAISLCPIESRALRNAHRACLTLPRARIDSYCTFSRGDSSGRLDYTLNSANEFFTPMDRMICQSNPYAKSNYTARCHGWIMINRVRQVNGACMFHLSHNEAFCREKGEEKKIPARAAFSRRFANGKNQFSR